MREMLPCSSFGEHCALPQHVDTTLATGNRDTCSKAGLDVAKLGELVFDLAKVPSSFSTGLHKLYNGLENTHVGPELRS